MTPPEPEINPEESEETSVTSGKRAPRVKWALTAEALGKLLDHFSTDREEAGRHYEMMRSKLVRYFEWRDCAASEDLADETINRVARRIDEGENILNLRAYFLSVAQLVFFEWLRKFDSTALPLDEVNDLSAQQPFADEQKEARLRCLDQGLAKLTMQNRQLILEYHLDDKRAKIDRRKELAAALGIPLNALRIRAHRIRTVLETSVKDCLGQPV